MKPLSQPSGAYPIQLQQYHQYPTVASTSTVSSSLTSSPYQQYNNNKPV